MTSAKDEAGNPPTGADDTPTQLSVGGSSEKGTAGGAAAGGGLAEGFSGATPGFVAGGSIPSIGGDAGGPAGGGLGGLGGAVGAVGGGIAGGAISEAAGGVLGGIAGGGITGGIAGGTVGGIGGIAEGAVGGVAGAGISGIAGAVGGKVTEAVTGSIGSVAGGIAGGIAGSAISSIAGSAISGITGAGKVSGIVAGEELPIFEEKAITSFTGKVGGPLVGKAGGLPSKAGAIASHLSGKNLEVEIASGDALDVRNFSVNERLSTLFQVNLVAISDNPSIEFDAVVGQPARFALHAGTHERFWAGLCNHFEQVRVEPSGASTYRISIVPALWLLTQRKNYRIFQQISEPDIVLKMLKEWDIEPEVRIDKGAYKKRKYRVQYAESDFAFISRMLEDSGIAYYFEQVGEETKLVLSDAPQSNTKRGAPLTFLDDTSMVQKIDIEFVTGVRMGQRVRPGKYTIRDHDYRKPPNYKLMTTASGGRGVEEKLERYHYRPGAFLFGSEQGEATPSADDKGKARTDEKEGAVLAQKRLDAKRGGARVCTFETNARDLAPGVVMNITGHPNAALDEGKTLLVVESSLNGTNTGEWSQFCEARGTDVPFRPESVTPRPKVNGVESATVVGPQGEEIHTDEFGRVRVHFHWDRESKMDDNSSCWIHVSQPWGGGGYGGINLPRIGQEVLVDFLGGDPDRPVVVGRVYTNLQKVPYKLPANKTQSGWRSNSTGGSGGYNEIMFEDAQGKELMNIQAERDLTELVKHDAKHTVKNDRTTTVWKSDSSLVGVSHKLTIAEPGSGEPSPGPTVASMSHKRIEFTTGEATITVQGPTITLSANSSIKLESSTIEIHATGGIVLTSDDKNVTIKGNPLVKINCSD